MIYTVRAPSNIALIKYMGKKNAGKNIPENSSISLTLDSLCSFTEVKKTKASSFSFNWVHEKVREYPKGLSPVTPDLNEKGVQRVLDHIQNVQAEVPELFTRWDLKWLFEDHWEFRSSNTFPYSAGIASSASSFAALTLATLLAACRSPHHFDEIWQMQPKFRQEVSVISRKGSGSSCRSFEGPWVKWDTEMGKKILTDPEKVPELCDLVLLISTKPKEVGSSEAHKRVKTSLLWKDRVKHATLRSQKLLKALEEGDLQTISMVAWLEAWEMHALFHSSDPAFSYMAPETQLVLDWFEPFIGNEEAVQKLNPELTAPPIVTMDAGPNVHCLVPSAEKEIWKLKLESQFPGIEILEDTQGKGARILI